LLFFRFAQDVAHIDEGYRALRRIQRPRASFSLAGFQVTFIGRFWVTAEGRDQKARRAISFFWSPVRTEAEQVLIGPEF
jgi:hypothetical protein